MNWLEYCISCKNWCCHNESPYASKDELLRLGVNRITCNNKGSCIFLDSHGKCKTYKNRPFECKIFPIDIQDINGSLYWVIWNVCPAYALLNANMLIKQYENTLLKEMPPGFVRDYVNYHKNNQPKKYSTETFKIVKRLFA